MFWMVLNDSNPFSSLCKYVCRGRVAFSIFLSIAGVRMKRLHTIHIKAKVEKHTTCIYII